MSLDGRIRQGLVQAADSVEPNVEGDLMKVQSRSRNRRRMQWAAGAVAVAAIGAFLFLGGTDLLDSTGDPKPIPPASTGNGEGTVAPTPEESETPPGTIAATVNTWFTSGETLRPDWIGVPGESENGHPIAENTIKALLNGTTDAQESAGLATQIPVGTELLGLDITPDGLATIDLTSEFESGGGSLSMRIRVAQVVYTLTGFESVQGVLFKIDGESVQAIGGEGVDVSSPQTRDDFEDLLPPITVTRPGIGSDLASGDTVEGTANVFEANVSWRILDEDGEEIASGFETASCGTGCRGGFTIEPEFSVDHDQEGTIEVLEYSAENGEPINVVSIPVNLLAE